MKDTIYLIVTNDKYELPVAEACSQAEIARRFGLGASAVCHAVKKCRAICDRKFKIVVLEE